MSPNEHKIQMCSRNVRTENAIIKSYHDSHHPIHLANFSNSINSEETVRIWAIIMAIETIEPINVSIYNTSYALVRVQKQQHVEQLKPELKLTVAHQYQTVTLYSYMANNAIKYVRMALPWAWKLYSSIVACWREKGRKRGTTKAKLHGFRMCNVNRYFGSKTRNYN